jgi:hypothetical protein
VTGCALAATAALVVAEERLVPAVAVDTALHRKLMKLNIHYVVVYKTKHTLCCI